MSGKLVPSETGGKSVVAVILAGGQGRRMGQDSTHKVCYEVAGVPFILRALQTYAECGIHSHVLVIGKLGEQIIQTVRDRFPHAGYAVQPQLLGTGHAPRCGISLLEALGYQGDILVAMGDRLLAPAALQRLLTTFRATGSDLTMLLGAKQDNPSSGR